MFYTLQFTISWLLLVSVFVCLTCKCHEDITVLCGHRFHPRLMRHEVSPSLQQPLSKQLIWKTETERQREKQGQSHFPRDNQCKQRWHFYHYCQTCLKTLARAVSAHKETTNKAVLLKRTDVNVMIFSFTAQEGQKLFSKIYKPQIVCCVSCSKRLKDVAIKKQQIIISILIQTKVQKHRM